MARTGHLILFQSRYNATTMVGPSILIGSSDTATYQAITAAASSSEVGIIGTPAAAAVVDTPSGKDYLSELNAYGLTTHIWKKASVSGALSAETDALGGGYPWVTLRLSVSPVLSGGDVYMFSPGHLYDTDGQFTTLSVNVNSAVPTYTRWSMACCIVYDDHTLGIPTCSLYANEDSFFSLYGYSGQNFGTTAISIYLWGGIAGYTSAANEKDLGVDFSGTDFSKSSGSNVLVFGGGHTVA